MWIILSTEFSLTTKYRLRTLGSSPRRWARTNQNLYWRKSLDPEWPWQVMPFHKGAFLLFFALRHVLHHNIQLKDLKITSAEYKQGSRTLWEIGNKGFLIGVRTYSTVRNWGSQCPEGNDFWRNREEPLTRAQQREVLSTCVEGHSLHIWPCLECVSRAGGSWAQLDAEWKWAKTKGEPWGRRGTTGTNCRIHVPLGAWDTRAAVVSTELTSSSVCWLDLLHMNSPGTSDSQGTMIRYESEHPKRTRQKLYHFSWHGPRTHISFLQGF